MLMHSTHVERVGIHLAQDLKLLSLDDLLVPRDIDVSILEKLDGEDFLRFSWRACRESCQRRIIDPKSKSYPR